MQRVKQLKREIEDLKKQDRTIQNSLASAGHRQFDHLTNLQEIIEKKIAEKQKEIKRLLE